MQYNKFILNLKQYTMCFFLSNFLLVNLLFKQLIQHQDLSISCIPVQANLKTKTPRFIICFSINEIFTLINFTLVFIQYIHMIFTRKYLLCYSMI